MRRSFKTRSVGLGLAFSLAIAIDSGGFGAQAAAAPRLPASQAPGAQAGARGGPRVWVSVDEHTLGKPTPGRRIAGSRHQTLRLDDASLRDVLARAPLEGTDEARKTETLLELPWPDGGFRSFRIEESPIMEDGLAAQFPEIKTYRGQGIDDPSDSVRFDRTPAGFHAMVFSAEGTVLIDPYAPDDKSNYRSYFKRDYRRTDGSVFRCEQTGEEISPHESHGDLASQPPNGGTLRSYRLALAATGEYTAFFGGTVPAAMSAIVTTMNRVNGIYERDLAVHMNLVANNNLVVYTNAGTDPYDNLNGSKMLCQNQINIDSVIGSANYDIGHVFSTGGGGVAYLQGVCDGTTPVSCATYGLGSPPGRKARGVTGSSAPVGDAFDVDYVAHEMGHQFGAPHTFNGTTAGCGGGNRSAADAFEPGSGSTIMAYAGICGSEDLQAHSDAYFHAGSQDDVLTFLGGAGGSCAATSATGNTPPSVSAGADYTIPIQTPFTLTAAGSDANGDSITYAWEQMDAGNPAPPNTDDGTRAIFRSFNPTASPSRTFPRLSNVLANTTSFGESLPTTTRALHFRVTARDNRAGGGGTASDDAVVNVTSSAGPFQVTSPNTAVSLAGGSLQTVTWNVANTAGPPVNATSVKISLSTDGGNTFPTVLAASTPNDGSENVTLPNVGTNTARIKVEAVGNIFFDVSNSNFTIVFTLPPIYYVVTNTLDSGTNSLRWAIDQANAKPGLDYVTFNIPGGGIQGIVTSGTLSITDQLVIDGTSQPGYGSPGPRVYVRGGAGVSALFILGPGSAGSTIQGLGLTDYASEAVTTSPSAAGNWIQYNWIGFYRADDGSVTRNSVLHPTSRGLTLKTSWTTVRWNVISGVQHGVVIGDDPGSPSANTYVTNALQANAIGTDPWTSTAAGYGNTGVGVLLLARAREMWIGPWNVVSGNASGGVQLLHSDNFHDIVFGNSIGTNSDGSALIANGGTGVSLANGAHENAIGGSWGGNVIAGNPSAGVSLNGVTGNWVQNNTIGLNGSQTGILGGQDVGVTVFNNSTLNTIEGNVLSGNTYNGAVVDHSTSNSVSRNYVGRSTGGTAFANGNYGIVLLDGANYNWVLENNFGSNPLGNFFIYPSAIGNIF